MDLWGRIHSRCGLSDDEFMGDVPSNRECIRSHSPISM